jgi:hypothetical protein
MSDQMYLLDIKGKDLSLLTDDDKKIRRSLQKKMSAEKRKQDNPNYDRDRMRNSRLKKSAEKLELLKSNKKQNIVSKDYHDKEINELKKQIENLKTNKKTNIVIDNNNKRPIEKNTNIITDDKKDKIFWNINRIQDIMGNPPLSPSVTHWINLILQVDSKISTTEIKKLSKYIFFINNKYIDIFIKKLNEITKIAKNSINTYLSGGWQIILNKFRFFNSKEFNIAYQKIYTYTKQNANEYNEERSKNILHKKDIGKIFDYNPSQTIIKLNKINNLKDKLIFALYTQNIAPRRLDYYSLKISYQNIKKLNQKHMDKKLRKNFVQIKNNTPVNFVFNNYKNFDKFGCQVIPIQHIVEQLLIDYMKQNDLEEDDYLFEPLDSNKFGKEVTKIFSKVYNTPGLSVNWIRKSAATYYQNLYTKKTNKKMYISWLMSHNVLQNSLYAKYQDNLSEDEEDDQNSFSLLDEVNDENDNE